ncbi:MAG: lipopolysaccharide assembly protein LapA domain-containing protein [Thermodesulfobacteriota bacterium]
MKAKKIIGILLTVIVVIFGIQNMNVVTINLLFWKLEMPGILLIFIVFIVGFLSGLLFKAFK